MQYMIATLEDYTTWDLEFNNFITEVNKETQQ